MESATEKPGLELAKVVHTALVSEPFRVSMTWRLSFPKSPPRRTDGIHQRSCLEAERSFPGIAKSDMSGERQYSLERNTVSVVLSVRANWYFRGSMISHRLSGSCVTGTRLGPILSHGIQQHEARMEVRRRSHVDCESSRTPKQTWQFEAKWMPNLLWT